MTVQQDQHLYTIPAGNGYSCLGFDVATKRARGVYQWMGYNQAAILQMYPDSVIGTEQGYKLYSAAMAAGEEYARQYKRRCPIELTPELVGLEGKRVEVLDSDGERRRFWVGRSTGWMPCHLEIARRDSDGGCPAYGAPYKAVYVIDGRKKILVHGGE